MNAHPNSVPPASVPETPALPEAPGFAQHLLLAARTLVPLFEAGSSTSQGVAAFQLGEGGCVQPTE